MTLDSRLFNLANGFAGKKRWIDFLVVFFAQYLAYILVLALLVIAFVQKDASLFLFPVLAGALSRFIVNEIIYFFYKRKRPSEVLELKTLVKTPGHPAFPSGHASFFFALSFALLPFSLEWAIVFIVLSSLMGFCRVSAGVHWPSDILAGAAAGGFSALLGYPLFLWILSNL